MKPTHEDSEKNRPLPLLEEESTEAPQNNRGDIIWQRAKGISLAFLSSVCFSLTILWVKMNTKMHAIEICLFKMIIGTVLSLPYLCFAKIDFKAILSDKKILFMVWIRAALGTTAFSCVCYAVQQIPVGDVTAIIFSAPIFVTIFGRIFLKEKCSIVDILTLIVMALGCTFVAHPQFLFGNSYAMTGTRSLGLVLATAGCLTSSLTFIVMRYIKSVNFMVILFTFSFWGIFQTLIMCLVMNVLVWPNTLEEWGLLTGMGLASFVGQMFLTKSFQYEKASLVSVVRTADIVLAFIYELLFLHYIPTTWSVVGANLVVGSVITTALKKLFTKSDQAQSDVEEKLQIMPLKEERQPLVDSVVTKLDSADGKDYNTEPKDNAINR